MPNDTDKPEDNPEKGSDGSESPDEGEELVDFVKEELGKEVDDPEKAKKMIKDTFSHVGKFGKYKNYIEGLEDKLGGESQAVTMLKGLVQEADEEADGESSEEDLEDKVNSKLKELDQKAFYTDNPEYKPYKNLIDKFGENPEEVVESEEFQEVYEKLQKQDGGDEKSVLHSNSRVGQTSKKAEQAKEKLNEGDFSGAEKDAVDAVLEVTDGE